MQLELKQLQIDGGTQPRVEIDEDVVNDYAEALREGATFPPVVAFHDGAAYWLADGFHRYHAHRRAGREQIEVDVREGTLREAILHSVGANADHGLRRTNEDKQKAVTTMLTNEVVSMDEEGNPWSDREIARRCAVHHQMVARLRDKLILDDSSSMDRTFVHHKTGKPTQMNTAAIRRANRDRAVRTKKPPRQWGGVAADASTPTRGHSQPLVRQTALNLPHNADSAARAVVSAMGEAFALELSEAITTYLKGASA